MKGVAYQPFTEDDAMERFVSRYRSRVTAVLCGFDRLVFRGTLLPLVRPGGMFIFLTRAGVQLLDFKDYVLRTSERVIESALAEARRLDRPAIYLQSSARSKEDLARRVLAERPDARGLICALRIVEPCMSFEYHRSPERSERGLKLRPRKCLHIYKYWMHPRFGFMSARIQTWFPFNVQICLNGREWLATELQRRGIDFKRHDNCFPWLGQPARAQRLMDKQLTLDWPAALDAIARTLNPAHAAIFEPWPMSYYWSAYQTEWATDLLFKDPRCLASVYPALVRHATEHFASPDIMRFLQRKAHGNFTGELVTSFKDRAEGVRVKHWVNGNSIKMYDKAGSVLRVETTIARTTDFKVYRPKQGDPDGKLAWLPLRKGVADLHRRAELSQRANGTYLDTLAAINDDTPLSTVLDAVSRHAAWRGRRVRALRIGDPADVALLEAISRGEFAIAGLRNRDLRRLLFPGKPNASHLDTRRLSARVSRLLRMLRAHGVIHKIQRSHRYKLSPKGRTLTAALFAARSATIKQLIAQAA
jgi:hypothetical protein